MSKRTLLWIGGIFFLGLFGCGLLFAAVAVIAGFGNVETRVTGDAVALVRVEGVILPGEGGGSNPFNGTSSAFSTTVVDHLKQANANDQVKAVVLVVDSPGGSVYASDEIYLQIQAMEKPIISSMGSVAASGGYYVSAPTDEIWASPHTITCSIGVIAQFLKYEKLANEYGVESVVFKSGKHKDMGSPFRSVTEEEQQIWQALIDEAYDAFVGIVSEGRGLSDDVVREMADGRICTGKQAIEMQLVDELGYLPDAIRRAGELGGIAGDPPLIEYTEEPGLLELLTSMLGRPSPLAEIRQLFEFQSGATLMYLYTGR